MKKILRFTADWCQPCKMLGKSIEEAKLSIPVEVIDIDNEQELVAEYKVRTVPTLVLLEDGKEVRRMIGAKSKDGLIEWVNRNQ